MSGDEGLVCRTRLAQGTRDQSPPDRAATMARSAMRSAWAVRLLLALGAFLGQLSFVGQLCNAKRKFLKKAMIFNRLMSSTSWILKKSLKATF